ncbi:hypothetical protein F5Y15DRAFT_323247 [Xylariaceae sp. FL0016]|nr:hypothetical protein F5Y15DRAFT_323247 [Xylariaceae sp. FL0016]
MATDSELSDIQAKVFRTTVSEVAVQAVTNSDSRPSEPCCVICLESITEPCVARPCNHRNFDYLCLLSWLEEQPTCPLCKGNIDQVVNELGDGNRVYMVPQRETAPRHRQAASPAREVQPARSLLRPRRQDLRRRPDRPARAVARDEAIVRRRRLYRLQLYSLHVGTNPRSGFREISPDLFADHSLVSRARMWLRRELQIFEFLYISSDCPNGQDAIASRRASNAEFLLEYIVAILKTIDIQGSQGQAEEMLKDFLGRENARLLLHELKNFLRSPWSLDAWDRRVQYPAERRHDTHSYREDRHRVK